MSDFKREFVKDFLAQYPDKEVLKQFIDKLPLNKFDKNYLIMKYCREKITPHKVFDKNYLIMKYCREKITPHKVMAYELNLSQRYVVTLQENIITKTIPFINMFFIKALETSNTHQS